VSTTWPRLYVAVLRLIDRESDAVPLLNDTIQHMPLINHYTFVPTADLEIIIQVFFRYRLPGGS